MKGRKNLKGELLPNTDRNKGATPLTFVKRASNVCLLSQSIAIKSRVCVCADESHSGPPVAAIGAPAALPRCCAPRTTTHDQPSIVMHGKVALIFDDRPFED